MPSPFSSSATTSFDLSGVKNTDALLNGTHLKWSSNAMTYSFPWLNGANSLWVPTYSEPLASTHFGLNLTQINAATNALQAWCAVANITMTEVTETQTNVGDFRFGFSSVVTNAGAAAWTNYPSSEPSAADIWISPSITVNGFAIGSQNYETLMHEIGHGLGLKHPGDYTAYGFGSEGPFIDPSLDYQCYTIMSYRGYKQLFWEVTQQNYIIVSPETPMVYDIAAIQYLYGANNNYKTGNDTYTFNSSVPFYKTIWDAGGKDTIDISNFTTNCSIDLLPGHYSSLHYINSGAGGFPGYDGYDGTNNLGIAFGAIIENVKAGSGSDIIQGNDADNSINGGGGNDTIDGGAGTDTAVFIGNFTDYKVSYNAASLSVTVVDQIPNRDGTDTLSSIENFKFTDVVKAASELTSGSVIDITPPTVTTFSPSVGLTGVAMGSDISLTFSEAIQKGAGSIVIHRDSATGPIVASYDSATSPNLTISGNTLTINPTYDLLASTHYFVTLAAGNIKDLANNSYAGTTVYDFTTASIADTTPPTILAFNPTDSATGVTVSSDIKLTFSEAIQRGTGNIEIHSDSETGPVEASYDAATSGNFSISGDTLTIHHSDLANNTHYFVTLDSGSIKDLAGNTYDGTSSYDFTTASSFTVLYGTSADDIFHVGHGNEAINGEAGLDTLIFSGNQSGYTITPAGVGFAVTDNVGNDGIHSIVNFEQLQFTDHTLTITTSPSETLLESYRIYKAAFDRAPDYAGLGYWYNVMNNGASLTQIAGGFIGSSEFRAMYGDTPTDSNFVSLLYQHVLGRTLDQGGYDFWINDLSVETRAQVLVHFSESAENIANVTGVIANGIIYEAYAA